VNRHRVFASAATLAVVTGITLGVWKLGGRGRQRDINADQRRSQDLQNVVTVIDGWFATERKLPQDLGAIRTFNSGLSLRDPITGVPYEYRTTGNTQYEVCATFALDGTAEPSQPQFMRFYSHSAGRQCFPINAARAGLYR
jgi:hypothetical protein